MLLISGIEILVLSTLLYYYLHVKTRISKKYILIDNLIVSVLSFTIIFILAQKNLIPPWVVHIFIIPPLILILGFSATMIRFYRTPSRTTDPSPNSIVSPADGNIIYIRPFESNEIPISIKSDVPALLKELTKTEILNAPGWLVGINMTPFDVHKNCAPISGKVVLSRHFSGKFLSLKDFKALAENERHTIVMKNGSVLIGVVQTASRLVKRIDSYIQEGQELEKGQWYGMIRFGSQVDLILPKSVNIKVKEGQQVYAAKTTIGMLIL